MLGQTDVGQLAPVFALLIAAVAVFGPGAVGITKLVDGVRSFDKGDTWPPLLWIALALVIGVVAALAFQINLAASLLHQVPALSDSHVLDGVWGQVLTGIAWGGMASYWHERMDLASSRADAAEAGAPPSSM